MVEQRHCISETVLDVNVAERQGDQKNFNLFSCSTESQKHSQDIIDTLYFMLVRMLVIELGELTYGIGVDNDLLLGYHGFS